VGAKTKSKPTLQTRQKSRGRRAEGQKGFVVVEKERGAGGRKKRRKLGISREAGKIKVQKIKWDPGSTSPSDCTSHQSQAWEENSRADGE